ncbi:MAG: hypothetical protein IKI50_05630 [Clostridia bacterium]|nr:hypothetical protein [Clostridia bacterium]
MQILQNFRTEPEMIRVFDALPEAVRQSIVFSGRQFVSAEHLQTCADYLCSCSDG